MDLNLEQNADSWCAAIAKAQILGYLLMSRSPVSFNVELVSQKLSLPPEIITAALKELEQEGRIGVVLQRALVTLPDVPLNIPADSKVEFLEETPEAAPETNATVKGKSKNAIAP